MYHAQNAGRYERQQFITAYEQARTCRLIVVIDDIFPDSVVRFEELIYDAESTEDLHLLLNSPGGDGETAVRLVRSAQARCRNLTVIVPDQAKSAATIMVLGAHKILMGPVSDLGPIDPQYRLDRGGALVSAKNLIAAVDDAEARVQENPDTFPLHASLLQDVTSLMVQRARSDLARTNELLLEALRSNPDRTDGQVQTLQQNLYEPLIEARSSHAAIFDARDAEQAGLPVEAADTRSPVWQLLWRLYTKYLMLGPAMIYEGRRASHITSVSRSSSSSDQTHP